jgi:hypothetical protein
MTFATDTSAASRTIWRHPLVLAGACLVGFVLVFVLNGGCTSRPRAPEIIDEPVYHNVQEGFRFFPPEGWRCQARGEFPPMEMKKERLFVEYKRLTDPRPASLMVSVVDLPESKTVSEYLQARLMKRETWQSLKMEAFEIDARPVERHTFTGRENQFDIVREVVVLRRNLRAYFFTGVFVAQDRRAKEQIRKAIASLVCTW